LDAVAVRHVLPLVETAISALVGTGRATAAHSLIEHFAAGTGGVDV